MASGLAFDPGPVTVLVGPNNSGKSLALRELHGSIHPNSFNRRGRLIVDSVLLDGVTPDQALELVKAHDVSSNPAHFEFPNVGRLRKADVNSWDVDGGVDDTTHHFLAAASTQLLDGQTRLSLVNPSPMGDLRYPKTPLQRLLSHADARLRMQEIALEATGLHLIVEHWTGGGNITLRLAGEPLPSSGDPLVLDEAVGDALRAASPIQQASDGVKSFLGLVLATLVSESRILLIDEPDAFLSPPLARLLGRILGSLAQERDGHLVVATHSADFLSGCIDSGSSVNIVRLTRSRDHAGAQLLNGARLKAMMQRPLLRSSGILSALFHTGAIVVEADGDRVIYEEIDRRLRAESRTNCGDAVFISGNGKHSIRDIVGPLREMGIPAAAVVDLDLLEDKADFSALLRVCGATDATADTFGYQRMKVAKAFDSAGTKAKEAGVQGLPGPEDRKVAERLIRDLSEYGVFPVPVGELEGWLAGLHGERKKKGRFLLDTLAALGTDPDAPTYLRPSGDDIWAFGESIAEWIADRQRAVAESASVGG